MHVSVQLTTLAWVLAAGWFSILSSPTLGEQGRDCGMARAASQPLFYPQRTKGSDALAPAGREADRSHQQFSWGQEWGGLFKKAPFPNVFNDPPFRVASPSPCLMEMH
jgi:hypothetical protein